MTLIDQATSCIVHRFPCGSQLRNRLKFAESCDLTEPDVEIRRRQGLPNEIRFWQGTRLKFRIWKSEFRLLLISAFAAQC
jgi:hypothetical protein